MVSICFLKYIIANADLTNEQWLELYDDWLNWGQ